MIHAGINPFGGDNGVPTGAIVFGDAFGNPTTNVTSLFWDSANSIFNAGTPVRTQVRNRIAGDGLINAGDAANVGDSWIRIPGHGANELLDITWYDFGASVSFRNARAAGGSSALEFHCWRSNLVAYSALCTMFGDGTFNNLQLRNVADTNAIELNAVASGFGIYTESASGDGDHIYLGIGGVPTFRFNSAKFINDSTGIISWSTSTVDQVTDRVTLRSSSQGALLVIGGTTNRPVAIGDWPAATTYAMFGNAALDHTSTANYALLQDNTGNTLLNAASTKTIFFAIANVNRASLATTLFTMLSSTQLVCDAGTTSLPGLMNCSSLGVFQASATVMGISNKTTCGQAIDGSPGGATRGYRMSSDSFLSWWDTTDIGSATANDLFLVRDAKGGLGIRGQPNGQKISILTLTELTTIAAAATTDTAIQIPANAVVLAVSVRVVTVIPTAATFTVTATTGGTTFNTAAVAVAANTTDAGTKAGAFYQSSASTIRITPNLSPGAATGQVRVTIHYYSITPATS